MHQVSKTLSGELCNINISLKMYHGMVYSLVGGGGQKLYVLVIMEVALFLHLDVCVEMSRMVWSFPLSIFFAAFTTICWTSLQPSISHSSQQCWKTELYLPHISRSKRGLSSLVQHTSTAKELEVFLAHNILLEILFLHQPSRCSIIVCDTSNHRHAIRKLFNMTYI